VHTTPTASAPTPTPAPTTTAAPTGTAARTGTAAPTGTANASYAYDNRNPEAMAYHRALAELFDEHSMRMTEERLTLHGSGPTSLRCLDLAAGGGGYAVRLAERLDPHGLVVATDIRPEHIPPRPRLRALRHDLNDPLPEGPWHFIHARLILSHLPNRRTILHRMVDALEPDGSILIEDLDQMAPERIVANAPTPSDAELLARFQYAHSQVLRSHGRDPDWALRAHSALIEEGLAAVYTRVHATSWPGNSPGTQLLAAGLGQLRAELHATGLSIDDLDRVHLLLHDSQVVLHGHRLVSTVGRRRRG
jgi:hypothetical protein